MLMDLPPWFLYSCTLILGLLVGSFLNVVILRKPKTMEHAFLSDALSYLSERYGERFIPTAEMQTDLDQGAPSITFDRSCCPSCGLKLKPWHNIPLVSFVLLGGRCAGCKKPISIQYPLIEALSGVLCVLCFWRFGLSVQTLVAWIFTWLLIALSGIDFRTQLLPDEMTLPLLWLGLILSCFGVFVTPVSAISGAAIGYLSLWSVYWLFKLLTGKEGMGYGDFKLLAALGAWTGAPSILLIVLLSAAVGATVGTVLVILRKHQGQMPMPFGPFLAAAGWIALIFGQQLISSYWQVMKVG
jgi:leader peptidase (prepilin peptidase) / N-methyltransferase